MCYRAAGNDARLTWTCTPHHGHSVYWISLQRTARMAAHAAPFVQCNSHRVTHHCTLCARAANLSICMRAGCVLAMSQLCAILSYNLHRYSVSFGCALHTTCHTHVACTPCVMHTDEPSKYGCKYHAHQLSRTHDLHTSLVARTMNALFIMNVRHHGCLRGGPHPCVQLFQPFPVAPHFHMCDCCVRVLF